MRRIFIDALCTPSEIFITEDARVLDFYSDDDSDRATALAQSFTHFGALDEIGEVVTLTGPGNFTAIRAGIGFARGLALAYDVPSLGIGTLDIDARIAGLKEGMILRDARGGRAYGARIVNHKIIDVSLYLTEDLDLKNAYSADLDPCQKIVIDRGQKRNALLALAEEKCGTYPAKATYVRPPDAAHSQGEKLVIVDDR